MLPNKSKLKEYQKTAENYLFSRFDDVLFTFNHFGIKADSKETYQRMKDEAASDGKVQSEIFWHGRHIATAKIDNCTFEIMAPKPDELTSPINKIINEARIDHISFQTNNFENVENALRDEIISRFDVRNTHGIKIQPKKGLIIEIPK